MSNFIFLQAEFPAVHDQPRNLANSVTVEQRGRCLRVNLGLLSGLAQPSVHGPTGHCPLPSAAARRKASDLACGQPPLP